MSRLSAVMQGMRCPVPVLCLLFFVQILALPFGSASAAADDRAQDFDLAAAHELGERFDEAERIYRDIIASDETQHEAWYRLGRLYLRTGRLDEASAALERVMQASEVVPAGRVAEAGNLLNHIYALRAREWAAALAAGEADHAAAFAFGRGLINSRRWDDGRLVLEELSRHAPEDPQVHYWLSQALLNLGQGGLGRQSLERSVFLAPGNYRLQLELAQVYQQQDAAEEAERLLEQIIDRSGDADLVAEANRRMAALQARRAFQGGEADAEMALRQAMALDPANLSLRMQLAALYERQERFDDAMAIYEETAIRVRGMPGLLSPLQARLRQLYIRKSDLLAVRVTTEQVDPEEVVDLARKLSQVGSHQSVVRLLEPSLRIFPDEPRLYFWYGRSLMSLGEIEPGVAAIEQSVELSPPNALLLMELGMAYARAERDESAEKVFQEVMTATRDPELQRRARRERDQVRARRLEQQQDHAGALALIDSLLTEYPQDRTLEIERGRLLLKAGRHDEADALLDHLLAQMPGDRALRMRLAQDYRQAGRSGRAVDLYEEILIDEPADLRVKTELARAHLDAAQYDPAFAAYADVFGRLRGAADNERESAELLLGTLLRDLLEVGTRLLQSGDLAAAERVMTGVASLAPDHPHVEYLLSEIYRERQEFARQAEHLERVVALSPGNLLMQRRLAIAWYRADRPAQAIPALESAIAVLPFDSELRLYLAASHEADGNDDRAREEYLRLLQLNPTEEWRMRALGRMGLDRVNSALEREDAGAAVDEALQLVELTPEEPEVRHALARAWRLAGEPDRSEEVYLELLTGAPDNTAARLELAQLYAGTDREDDAIRILHELAVMTPPVDESLPARSRMDRLLLARAESQVDAMDARQEQDRPVAMASLLSAGRDMFELEGYAAALVIFEYLVRNDTENAEAYFWLGRLHALLDRHNDSVVLLKRSVELAPSDPRYLAALGRAYREAQLPGPAIEAMEQALALDEDLALRFELAALYEDAGDPFQSGQHYRQIWLRSADEDLVRETRAALDLPENPDDLGAEQLAAVLAWMMPVSADLPLSAEARLYTASLLLRQGHGDDAVALMSAIADGEGDPAVRNEAARRQVAALSLQADALAADMGHAHVDPSQVRELAKMLVQRQHPERALGMLEAAVQVYPEDPQLWYWLGRASMLSDQPGPGIAALERSVFLAQDNMLLRFELGLGYQGTGQPARAAAEFSRVAESADAPGLRRDARRLLSLMRGQQLARSGDFAGALEHLDNALALAPGDRQALMERGKVLVMLGRHAEADSAFDQLLRLAPEDRGVRMQLASIYRGRGEVGKSLAQLAAVIRLDPASAEARLAREQLGFNRGVTLLEEGEHAPAAEIFERILTIVPEDHVTRFELGRVYYQQRRLAESEIQLTDVVRRDPGRGEAYLLLGRLYEVLERDDSAVRAYEKVLEIDRESEAALTALPLLAALYSDQFEVLIAAGRMDDATLLMQRLVNNAPENVQARVDLARLYFQINRNDDALRELREAVRMQPDNAAAHRLAGIIHAGAARHVQAAESYAAAIAADTNIERAGEIAIELVMAVVLQMLDDNRPFAAIRHLRSLADAGRASERAWYTLAVIYRQQGRNEDAIRAMREAVRLSPENMQMRFNLAELYERNADEDLALVQYREIVRRGAPGDRFVEEARRRGVRLRDTLALLSSQLRYSLSLGDTVLREQDVDETGAPNSAFNSQLFYNLGLNFRPRPALHLRLDTGLFYIGNHSTEEDILVPRVGMVANLNHPDRFYSGSVDVTEIKDLMRDVSGGRTVNANFSAGVRFRDTLALFRVRRASVSDVGERDLVRAAERRMELVPGPDNPRLRASLQRRHDTVLPVLELAEDDVGTPEAGRDTDAVIEEGMALYRSGWSLLRQGRLDLARARFEALLQQVQDDPLTLVSLGVIHQRQQDLAAAETAYLAALAVAPDLPVAQLRLAEIYAQTGRVPDARALIEAVVASPDLTDLERRVADSHLQFLAAGMPGAGDDAEAVGHRDRLGQSGLDIVLDHIDQGRFDQALERLETMLVDFPDDPLLRLNLGVVYLRQGKMTDAETTFQGVLDQDPRNLNAVLRLGMVYGESQRHALALSMLERVISEGGGHPIVARAEKELERLERHRLGALTGAVAQRRDPVEKRLQGRAFFTDSSLPGRSLTETYSYGIGLSLTMASVRRGEWLFNYLYGVRENEDVLGTDYAYDWHEVGISLQSAVPNIRRWFGAAEYIPGLTGQIGLSHERRSYRYHDTHARYELEQLRRRSHATTTLMLGINYSVPGHERLSYFMNLTRGIARSNLPVGFVHDGDGNPVAFQSAGLGDFDTGAITAGLQFRF